MSTESDYIKLKQFWLLWFYRLCLLTGFGIPCVVLVCLTLSVGAETLEESAKLLAILWVFAVVVTILFMLHFIVESAQRDDLNAYSQSAQCFVGVFATLVAGVPSVFLSALPFLVQDIPTLGRVYSRGNVVDVSGGSCGQRDEEREEMPVPQDQGQWRVRYVVAIDVSRSFLTEPRENQVAEIVDSLFRRGGVAGAAIARGGSVDLYFFADGWKRVYRSEENPGVTGDREVHRFLGRDNVKTLLERVRTLREVDPNPEMRFTEQDLMYTDFLAFLGEIADKMDGWYRDGYRDVRFLIFSDFMHSVNDWNVDEFREGALQFARTVRRSRGVTLVGFHPGLEPSGGQNVDNQGYDIRGTLPNALPSGVWEETELGSFSSSSREDKLTRLSNLYGQIGLAGEPLELKYLAPFGGRPLRSHLKLPCGKNADEVLLRLNCPESDSRPVKLWLGGTEEDAFLLAASKDQDFLLWSRRASSSNPLPVQLSADYYGLPDGTPPELVVAFPGKSAIYHVPLSISGASNPDLNWLWWIAVIISAVPLRVINFEWSNRYIPVTRSTAKLPTPLGP